MPPFKDLLDNDGLAMVADVLQPETVEQLSAAIECAVKDREEPCGHAMRHLLEVVPAVRQVAQGAAVRSLIESVLGPNAFVVRSIFFDKTPEANWKVAWHQDLTISVRQRIEAPGFTAWSVKDGAVHVQPPVEVLERMLALRLHIDDCGPANGPLRVIPGSHKSGRLTARQIAEWRQRQEPAICAVARGGALLMRPLLLHASSPAREPKHRRVMHLEFSADALPGGLKWA